MGGVSVRLVSLLFLAFTSSENVMAQCAQVQYRVRGRIVNCCAGNCCGKASPVKRARIAVILDDEEFRGVTANSGMTDDTGEFNEVVSFGTSRGYSVFWGHNCTKRARTVRVIVLRDNHVIGVGLSNKFNMVKARGG